MKTLLLTLTLLSSSLFAGGNTAELSCATENGSYNMKIDTTYGTISVVKASEIKLVSFDKAFSAGNVKFVNSSTSQLYINNNAELSAVFFAEIEGEAKRIQIDSLTNTITTLDIASGREDVETQVVCDLVELDV